MGIFHENISGNGAGEVNFVKSKNLFLKSTKFPHRNTRK